MVWKQAADDVARISYGEAPPEIAMKNAGTAASGRRQLAAVARPTLPDTAFPAAASDQQ